MTREHLRDAAWSLRIGEKFLDPVYARRGWSVARHPADSEQQRRHVDVTLIRPGDVVRRIDEKIIRGRRDGLPAINISYETMSCTIPGFERPGWGARDERNDSTHLLVCFADLPDLDDDSWRRVCTLDCMRIPFPPLRDWFWRMGGECRWPIQHNGQSNGSISHKVPIGEILAEFPDARRFKIWTDGVAHRVWAPPRLRLVS
jgi:hypothetical protein